MGKLTEQGPQKDVPQIDHTCMSVSLLRFASEILPSVPLQPASLSVHMNAGCHYHMITLASDKHFELFDMA
jgi:hypothetical protein